MPYINDVLLPVGGEIQPTVRRYAVGIAKMGTIGDAGPQLAHHLWMTTNELY